MYLLAIINQYIFQKYFLTHLLGILSCLYNQKWYDESFKNIKKHVACSFSFKLASFGCKFLKPFKSYLGEDAFYNFINSMVMKDIVTKNLQCLKKRIKILRTLLYVAFVMLILMVMLKHEIIVTSLEKMRLYKLKL